jgi:hypothetical protein
LALPSITFQDSDLSFPENYRQRRLGNHSPDTSNFWNHQFWFSQHLAIKSWRQNFEADYMSHYDSVLMPRKD